MACAIINGIQHDCLDALGGVSEIYITEWANVPQANITSASGAISAMTCSTGKKFWIFSLEKEESDFKQNAVKSVENNSIYFEQTLTFPMKKMSAANRNALHLLLKNRLMVIVKDSNGSYQLMGEVNAAHVTAAEGGTGKMLGDKNGYAITIVGKEPNPANFVASNLLATLTVAA